MREIHGHEGSELNNHLVIESDNRDENGGAHTYAIELVDDQGYPVTPAIPVQYLQFQKGPLKEAGLNGITDEALLAIVMDRLQGFQSGPFSCRENAIALTKLEEAMHRLNDRTRARQARGVEGTHQV